MVDQANVQSEDGAEQQPVSPGESGEAKSDIEILSEKIKKLEEENKRIREEKLDSRTSPSYFEQMREEKRKQREAKILNTAPPKPARPTREQLEQMSPADLVDYVDHVTQQMYQTITTEKIYPLVEQSKEDNAQAQLKHLDSVYPKWEKYIPVMTEISKAQPNAKAADVLKMAMAKTGDYDALRDLSESLGEVKGKTKPKGATETMANQESKDIIDKTAKQEVRRPVSGAGEKPTVSIGNVKTPGKPMKANEAARKAYEQVFENRS